MRAAVSHVSSREAWEGSRDRSREPYDQPSASLRAAVVVIRSNEMIAIT